MSQFHKLRIADIRRETPDTVSVSFEIPDSLKNDFEYIQGQYITIRADIGAEDIRRSYSLCSAPSENDFRVAVKKVEGGRMSTWLNEKVRAGEELDVMPPMGNFYVDLDPSSSRHYVGFTAGSGITPIMSIVKETLLKEPSSSFTLFYGNRTRNDVIFAEELEKLSAQYNGRLTIHYIMSRETMPDDLFSGRITTEKCVQLLDRCVDISGTNAFFLCGPGDMINNVAATLEAKGVDKSKIHFELFTTPVADGDAKEVTAEVDGESQVTVIMDGEEYSFALAANGDPILDAAMDAGVDAPYSCKGAVCCTCKAKLLEGKAEMEMNYALTDMEVEEGYILTCQAHPTTAKVVLDYDVV